VQLSRRIGLAGLLPRWWGSKSAPSFISTPTLKEYFLNNSFCSTYYPSIKIANAMSLDGIDNLWDNIVESSDDSYNNFLYPERYLPGVSNINVEIKNALGKTTLFNEQNYNNGITAKQYFQEVLDVHNKLYRHLLSTETYFTYEYRYQTVTRTYDSVGNLTGTTTVDSSVFQTSFFIGVKDPSYSLEVKTLGGVTWISEEREIYSWVKIISIDYFYDPIYFSLGKYIQTLWYDDISGPTTFTYNKFVTDYTFNSNGTVDELELPRATKPTYTNPAEGQTKRAINQNITEHNVLKGAELTWEDIASNDQFQINAILIKMIINNTGF
jgi:hypothetical protein